MSQEPLNQNILFPTTQAYLAFYRGAPGATRLVVERAAAHLECYQAQPAHLRIEIARSARLLAMLEAPVLFQAAGKAALQERANALGHAGTGPTAQPPSAVPAPAGVLPTSGLGSSVHSGMEGL